MSASVIPQALAATSTALAGKVVRFELFHDGVDLYESIEGLVVTRDLPARRLLTSFPIVKQDDELVVIDFNRGMRRVFTEIWYASNSGFSTLWRDQVLEVPHSRVFDMQRDGNQLVIRQSVQARSREYVADLEDRIEVRYFISPYEPSSYEGKEMKASETRYARFFETQATLEEVTGREVTKMARFEISSPVTFYYSANTPADYVDAVKEGILYWNRAFDREVIKVEKAPEGVTAPDSKHNVIQWVPWDNAGFAYADILVDPLTGESRHGQAYITSVFAISGKSRARSLLRTMQDLIEKETKEEKDESDDDDGDDENTDGTLPLLASAPGCQVNPLAFALQYAQGLEELLASDDLTDEAVLKASQDYVREVVAHEVGHVLGLRHNFAGSLAATMTHEDLDDWFKRYVAGEDLEKYAGKHVTSSIMEYSVFKAGVHIGWMIGEGEECLPHDRAAIQWGYFDSQEPVEKRMLFATDQDSRRYGDVKTFDYGVEPVVAAYAEIASLIGFLPNNLIETFIQARAPRDARDRIPLEQVNLNPLGASTRLASNYRQMLQWFRSETRSHRLENSFDYVGELNEQARFEAHWESLNAQLKKLGGLDRALFSFIPLDLKLELKDQPQGVPAAAKIAATNLTAELKKLLDSPAYDTFVGLDEKVYSWSEDDKKLIVERGQQFFEEFEKEVVQAVCQQLEGARRDLGVRATRVVGEEDIVAKLEQRAIDIAKIVITTKSKDRRLKGMVDQAFVEVIDFEYDYDARVAAAKALGDVNGSFKGWAKEAKGGLNTQLKKSVEAALNISNFKNFSDSMLSRPLRYWYLQQQDILRLLPPAPKAGDKEPGQS